MSHLNPAILNPLASHQSAAPATTIAEFYQQLISHDWYYSYSEDSSVYRAGSDNLDRLEQLALDCGPLYVWLMKEVSKAHFSGPSWSTPKHPMPTPPAPVGFDEQLSLIYAIAKADLEANVRTILGKVNPFAGRNAKPDPREPILNRVRLLGAYAGNDEPPTLLAHNALLRSAWANGQKLVAEFAKAQ
ncbi:hypothetical protein GIW05_00510 [Pseudomonas syringae]|uniref:hypothetical protein n=1 Tax=Pseudomonas syringae TaxID=317 RepID=UPI001F1B9637|nr:hypothetical protein [Pseudomonas syringae]MCF5382003.1 hypothetical protein [Pseudomonas syringae]MCF5419464.1 hypothetical protein [Pseudomonas syringae]MCF5452010.1 hypothetical protein [Pseudomonas syringae]MCF5456297.1 hypothetical protein [Pseudomonas syringae]